MYFKIFLVCVLLIFVSFNSAFTFDSESAAIEEDVVHVDEIPAHLRWYGYNLVCKLQPNGYDCNRKRGMSSRFYYDTKMGTCMTFSYGECNFSQNKFDTLKECNRNCFDSKQQETNLIWNLTDNVICRLQPEFGNCYKYHPMYYFDVTTRTCKGFSFSGCGGNYNRFVTPEQCKKVCLEVVSIPQKAGKADRVYDKIWGI